MVIYRKVADLARSLRRIAAAEPSPCWIDYLRQSAPKGRS